jgi:tetratricopeptide (TPR) repeat protein
VQFRDVLSRRQRIVVITTVLVTAILLIYAPALRNGFVGYDDPEYVTSNPHVNTGFSRENVVWAFTAAHSSNWHPLTWLSHALDCKLYGLNPVGHHLTSVLLHAANTLLLFWFLNAATGAVWRSALVAALFGLHPLHVESVAWVAERKDVLSTFFGMLAMLAYLRRRAVLVAVLLACGLMAKPMLVSLPLLLLALDWWPLQRKFSIAGKLPLFGLAAAASAMTIWAQRQSGSIAAIDGLPLGLRLSNAVVSYVEYLGKAIWPARLAVLYPFPVAGIPAWRVTASAALLIAITALVIVFRKQRPWLLVGWCWYLVTLAPVIGIVQAGMQSMADRYLYIPMIGLLIAMAWELSPRAIPVAGVLVVACAVLTWRQIPVWHDGVTLFEHTLAVTQNNFIAQNNLGVELDRRGQPEAALVHYKEAVRIRPGDRHSENNYAQAMFDKGKRLLEEERFAEALAAMQESVRHRDDNAQAHLYAGVILASFGRYSEALASVDRALLLEPDLEVARRARAELLKAMGR